VTLPFQDSKYDTWEPITHFQGSENMITELKRVQHQWEEDCKIKTEAALQPVIDKRVAGADGDDDDKEGMSAESESEHEDEDGEGGGGQRTL